MWLAQVVAQLTTLHELRVPGFLTDLALPLSTFSQLRLLRTLVLLTSGERDYEAELPQLLALPYLRHLVLAGFSRITQVRDMSLHHCNQVNANRSHRSLCCPTACSLLESRVLSQWC